MTTSDFEESVAIVRRFNRFFTRQVGVLREGLLHTPYSLTEARILFEVANDQEATASDLARHLGLDPGYLSRTLSKLEKLGLLERVRSEIDGRRLLLHLTKSGERVFTELDKRASDEVVDLLGELSVSNQKRLLEAMQVIEEILGDGFKFSGPFVLRQHETGDMGWVVQQHAVLYQQEYGWNEEFESLVARIVAEFIGNYDRGRERCWIAEMNGERVGSIFLVKQDDTTAKIRLLLVEPKARGLGLGKSLVDQCIKFARRSGYKTLTLWTNDVLTAARRIYESVGFRLKEEEIHHSFGRDLVGQHWELDL